MMAHVLGLALRGLRLPADAVPTSTFIMPDDWSPSTHGEFEPGPESGLPDARPWQRYGSTRNYDRNERQPNTRLGGSGGGARRVDRGPGAISQSLAVLTGDEPYIGRAIAMGH